MDNFSPWQMALIRAGTERTPYEQQRGLGDYLAEEQNRAAALRLNQAQLDAYGYEMEQQKKLQEMMQNIDINDPQAVAALVRVAPELGLKLMQEKRLKDQFDAEQQMMQGLMSSGAGAALDDDAASAYMMAESDNPILAGKGKQLIADRERQQKLEDEARKQQADIEKEQREPPTEAQANAANFATRMNKAEIEVLTPLEIEGISTANAGEKALSAIPLIGNFLTSEDYKLYRQAQEDWVRAKLRKESGAVIGEDEMSREITTYFPQVGDTAKVIEQKRKARQTALQGVAGGAKKGFADTLNKPPEGGKVIDLTTLSDEELMQLLQEAE